MSAFLLLACTAAALQSQGRQSQGPVADAKRAVLSAVSGLRRTPSAATRNAVLRAVEDLEACSTGTTAPVDGRWSLIFSTQVAENARRDDAGANILQPAIDATYSAFFKVAPALAGAAPDGSSSGASNEQSVDTSTGALRNRVRVPLPFGLPRLEILVDGEAAPKGGDELGVVFSDCTFRLGDSGDGLRLPLPRPVGSLVTTHCDDDLRISRGGRGGIFVLRRLRSEQ